jgi:hypothetical protein
MQYETYLPIFSGFYGTMFEFDYENIEYQIQQDRKEKGLLSDFDELDIDNSQYEKDIVLKFCEVLQKELNHFVNKIELQSIYNPKEYNFANDSANVLIDININEISSFIYANKSAFETFLNGRYTSYDGFISHYNNDFESWEKDTKGFTDFSIDGHRLGSILDFIARMNDIKEYDIYENVIENIDTFEYIKNYEELLNQQDGTLFEKLTASGYSSEYAKYLYNTFENGNINNIPLDENTLSIIKEFEAEALTS